jgi:hypothetical protein
MLHKLGNQIIISGRRKVTVRGSSSGVKWPARSITQNLDPGIRFANSLWAASGVRLSSSPQITVVGQLIRPRSC